MQAVPQPYDQVSFQRDGLEIARYHFGASLKRPFVFPLLGPSGRSLTRMGHPHDPVSHSHHNSVWIAHQDVGGVAFWGDTGKGRIVQQKIDKLLKDLETADATSVTAKENAHKALLKIEQDELQSVVNQVNQGAMGQLTGVLTVNNHTTASAVGRVRDGRVPASCAASLRGCRT